MAERQKQPKQPRQTTQAVHAFKPDLFTKSPPTHTIYNFKPDVFTKPPPTFNTASSLSEPPHTVPSHPVPQKSPSAKPVPYHEPPPAITWAVIKEDA